MDNDPHADTVGYYTNWPGRTKREVDMMLQYGGNDWPDSKIPIPDPRYTETFDDDLIPTEDDIAGGGGISEEWANLSSIVEAISVADAYDMWIGKGKVKRKNGEVKIRCPLPEHADNNPSATMNIALGKWHCHACQVGGGVYELAAIHFGYSFDDIKGPTFKDLKRAMAEDLGWVSAGVDPKGEPRYHKPGTQDTIIEQVQTAATEPPPDEPQDPGFDWREVTPVGTPLYEWMLATTRLQLPDEYLFFGGLQILGLAGGRDVYWMHEAQEIYPNLYLLLIGTTATGKSRACRLMERVILESLPFSPDLAKSKGVTTPGTPASGEGVMTAMSPAVDETDEESGKPGFAKGVKAWWFIDEFANLAAHKGRQGDNTESTLMTLYDNPPRAEKVRSKQADTTTVIDPFTTVTSTVQPRVINEYMNRTDVHSGYANRWIPVHGTAKARARNHGYTPNLEPFVLGLRGRQTWAEHGVQLQLTPDAMDAWFDFCSANIDPLLMDEENPMGSIYGRIEVAMQKIMIIFCINEQKTQINVDILNRALQLWPFLLSSYNRLVGRIESGKREDLYDKVRNTLREHGDMIHGQLKRAVRMNTDEFITAIKALKETGEVAVEPYKPERGRPTIKYLWMG